MIGSSSQAKICTSWSELSSYREIRFCNFQKRVSLLHNTKSTRWRNSGLSFTLNAVQSSPVRSDRRRLPGSSSKPKSVRFFKTQVFVYSIFVCSSCLLGDLDVAGFT